LVWCYNRQIISLIVEHEQTKEYIKEGRISFPPDSFWRNYLFVASMRVSRSTVPEMYRT